MNISDLSKLDLQKIDYKKLQEMAMQRRDFLINAGIIAFTLFFVVSNFSNKFKEDIRLKNKISEMVAKQEVIKEYNQGLQDTETYIKNFPPALSVDKIIQKVTESAQKNNMRLVYFSPARTEKSGMVEKTSIQFSVNAKKYQDVFNFVKSLEHSTFALRIDNWQATPEEDVSGQNSTEVIKTGISVNLVISTIKMIK